LIFCLFRAEVVAIQEDQKLESTHEKGLGRMSEPFSTKWAIQLHAAAATTGWGRRTAGGGFAGRRERGRHEDSRPQGHGRYRNENLAFHALTFRLTGSNGIQGYDSRMKAKSQDLADKAERIRRHLACHV
jgi:hypothetical protein